MVEGGGIPGSIASGLLVMLQREEVNGKRRKKEIEVGGGKSKSRF